MKVRAVTYFISAQSFEELCERVDASVGFFRAAIGELRARGVDLQMVRIATNGCDQWADAAPARALEQLVQLDGRLGALEAEVGGGVSVIASLGQLDSRLEDGVLVAALSQTSRLFACVAMRVSADGLPDLERAHACARLVLQLNDAARTTGGLVVEGPLAGAPFCFKLAVTARLGAGTPFFPGAYAPPPGESASRLAPAGSTWAAPAFAFACENSDLLVAAFARARKSADASGGCVLRAASAELAAEFGSLVGQLDALGAKLEAQCPGVAFAGTDSSVASAACPEHSLVAAFESLGVGRFGGAGTTAICALVTAVLRGLPYRLVGYCGLSACSARPPSTRAGCALRLGPHGSALAPFPPPCAQCCRRRRTPAWASWLRAAACRSAACCSTRPCAARASTRCSCRTAPPPRSSPRSTPTWAAWPRGCASRSPRASGRPTARARASACA